MAQYAYNDIFDDYVPTRNPGRAAYGNTAPRANAAPKRKPSQKTAPQKQRPDLKRVEGTKKDNIIRDNKTIKYILLPISLIMALILSLSTMAIASKIELNNAIAKLETLESDYELCLEQNNTLKYQLDEATKGVDIEKYAEERLGLVKVPDSRTGKIRISDYS